MSEPTPIKPTKKSIEFYNFFDALRYIKDKHGIDPRNYDSVDPTEVPRRGRKDFWHLYSDCISGNGSMFHLDFDPLYTKAVLPDQYGYPEWGIHILQLIKDEFSPDSDEPLCFIVEW